MSHFFERPYSQEDLQRQVAQRRQNAARGSISMNMAMSPSVNHDDAMSMTGMVGGDSLDDIILQNTKELQRRQSLPQQYPPSSSSENNGKPSMIEFGALNDSLNGFQFGAQPPQNGAHTSRRQSQEDINMAAGFADMTASLGLGAPGASFSTSVQQPNSLSIDTSNSYGDLSNDVLGNVMFSGMSEDTTPINMFMSNAFSNHFSAGSMAQMSADYNMSMVADDDLGVGSNGLQNPGSDGDEDIMASGLTTIPETNVSMPGSTSMNRSMAEYNSPTAASTPQNLVQTDNYQRSPMSGTGAESQSRATQVSQASQPQQNFHNIYSSSGFDMLGALMRVATRKNPEINIGAVDMSCAFVVCDVTQPDCPIVYVSDIFERLTGYNKHEVLGRNCRFLQAPDGKVMAGLKRMYVDDDSVYYLKSRIKGLKEAQRSLINYRKGGQPFMNLLTMIPIAWDTEEIRYIVGFQVDLVEQPSSVAGKGQGGSYTVNYSQGMLPRYVWTPPGGSRSQPDSGQTISRDDVSAILTNFSSSPGSELSKRMWDKVLLENTDDVVHVLSLKGLFLYLSPSSKHVLEYDASELVGTALSSVCHPSDIVPVTRELKDTSTGATVNVVFRIRRKKSGYTWFESHGSLCIEQGKGRKCIILVGRERPVYALSRHDVEAAGGVGENELWTKLSTSGMFLYVSSNIRILLDRQPGELIGTSLQALMRPESRLEFGRSLERARNGKRITYKHEVINKRGQMLQAQTTLYPGDASEGQKPTFLVGQTRLLKPASRGLSSACVNQSSSRSTAASGDGLHDALNSPSHSSSLAAQIENRGDGTPRSSASTLGRDHVVTQAGGSGLLIGSQDVALASEDNIFDELKTTRCTSWQFELRQMEKSNRLLAEELASLLSNKKKRKRRKGAGNLQRDCANCHTRVTPEWRRGPSGNRDLCNSCGLRWAKQNGRISPRASSRGDAGSKKSVSPVHSSSLSREITHGPASSVSLKVNSNPALEDHPQSVAGIEKRSITDIKAIPAQGRGFLDGGPNEITKIDESDEPGT
ncbi:MAG: blue light receptor [Claussenomyces sp. TS43310]|nr:MAG: blue light receptor [Claussenomyces sp. TS43310]